jgi:hypothetical protein
LTSKPLHNETVDMDKQWEEEIGESYESAFAADGTRTFEWFACDKCGNLAIFYDDGNAAIPRSVFSDRKAYVDTAWYMLHADILAPSVMWNYPPEPIGGDWSMWVTNRLRRGLSVFFSWGSWEEPYKQISRPPRPMRLEDCPEAIRAYLAQVALPVDFATVAELNPMKMLDCI